MNKMKVAVAAAMAMALTVSTGVSAFAAEADLPGADVAEQGYDFMTRQFPIMISEKISKQFQN